MDITYAQRSTAQHRRTTSVLAHCDSWYDSSISGLPPPAIRYRFCGRRVEGIVRQMCFSQHEADRRNAMQAEQACPWHLATVLLATAARHNAKQEDR